MREDEKILTEETVAEEVEHSPKFNTVKDCYDRYVETNGAEGWSLFRVGRAVVKNWITVAEYVEITGVVYEEA